jgi:alpha-1,3-mannosyl-glycoprotein beta-1,2-N-acetylglucosaminyltransferase
MWLSSTIGMLFFHDYYKKTPKANNNVADPMIPGVSQPKFIAQEARLMAPNEPHTSPLLIFTCQRDNYLKQTLDDILKYIPPDCSIGCPIIISQDGNNQNVANVIRDAQIRFQTERNIPLVHLVHPSALRGAPNRNAYQALAIHYGWALTQVFDNKAQAQGIHVSPERVIILEEDLHIAPDFFGYFAAMVPVLDNDSTLFAVSAFNDNGFEGRVSDPRRLLRTDFFPGLGWMMTRRLWDNELKMKWPDGYWDDWLRDSRQRQGRQVIRPEVSRTYHFGFEGGASGNQFGRLLQKIHLDTEAIDWGSLDISLLSPEMFDRYYWNIISNAKRVNSVSEALVVCKLSDVLLEYQDFHEFQELGRQLQLMIDEKDGILRTSYRGVVETRPHGGKFLLLTPPFVQIQRSFDQS